jgi:NAD(P) transhydrogenase
MTVDDDHYQLVVLGSGPSGQKAAIQGAKAGLRVIVVEREVQVGGACVHQGTIPSKTLREAALQLSRFRQRAAAFRVSVPENFEISSLMGRLGEVIDRHAESLRKYFGALGIDRIHGRGRFLDSHTVEVVSPGGGKRQLKGDRIVVAAGSRPRDPKDIPVDHEHILDSDSILSMSYLPRSLVVLGGGVIACEYASIFQALEVNVTIVNRSELPLAFLEPELSNIFVDGFHRAGGSYLGGCEIESIEWDGISAVATKLADGRRLEADKVLFTLGRVANTDGLGLDVAGVKCNERGMIDVDHRCQTSVPHIFAVGDVIGPPSLASASMEQGRRAIRHALHLEPGTAPENIPVGIYTIPEMSSVGLTEAQAREEYDDIIVGRARLDDVARGHIMGVQGGMLKLIADANGDRILGAQIAGDGATELIHLAQTAIIGGLGIDYFIQNIFNFPTLAEAYREAAIHVAEQRPRSEST